MASDIWHILTEIMQPKNSIYHVQVRRPCAPQERETAGYS
jgi:hypothetical protein